MAVISFRFRVCIRSEKYSNHNAVRLHRSEFETTLHPRKTGYSETDQRALIENFGMGGSARLYLSSYEEHCDCVCVGGLLGDVWVCGFFVRPEPWAEGRWTSAAGGESARSQSEPD